MRYLSGLRERFLVIVGAAIFLSSCVGSSGARGPLVTDYRHAGSQGIGKIVCCGGGSGGGPGGSSSLPGGGSSGVTPGPCGIVRVPRPHARIRRPEDRNAAPPPLSGGGGCPSPPPAACSISSQTTAQSPPNTNRTTLGVGEAVTLTTTAANAVWAWSGDGTLDSTSGSQVSLNAGNVAGSVTVTVGGDECSSAQIVFTVIAPSATYFSNFDNNVFHTYKHADIGILTNVYVAPDSVSFQYIQVLESNQAKYSANGAWACLNGTPHDANSQPADMMTSVVPGLGTQMKGQDMDYSGDCQGTGNFPVSSITINIPEEYYLSGMNTPAPYATAAQTAHLSSGSLTLTKNTPARAQTTVDSQSQGY